MRNILAQKIGCLDCRTMSSAHGFLAIAGWPRLEALLSDLAAERKEAGYS